MPNSPAAWCCMCTLEHRGRLNRHWDWLGSRSAAWQEALYLASTFFLMALLVLVASWDAEEYFASLSNLNHWLVSKVVVFFLEVY